MSQPTELLAADLDTGSKIAKKATMFDYLFLTELLEGEQKPKRYSEE